MKQLREQIPRQEVIDAVTECFYSNNSKEWLFGQIGIELYKITPMDGLCRCDNCKGIFSTTESILKFVDCPVCSRKDSLSFIMYEEIIGE